MIPTLNDPVKSTASGLLVARIGPFPIAFDVKFISSLASYAQILDPPEACDGYYYGAIQCQRKRLPLVGLYRKLGIPPARGTEGQAVVVNIFEETQVALRIDEVLELAAARAPLLLPLPPGLMELEAGFFRGWVQIGEVGAFLINTEKMFDEADVETLCAYLY